jgi:hypothetical protein
LLEGELISYLRENFDNFSRVSSEREPALLN